jgi:hypothetical protein
VIHQPVEERAMAGSIYGTVKNQAGVLLTASVVSCPNLNVTNSNGSYVAIVPTGGTYEMTAACTGYVTKVANVTVSTGQNKQKNFVLNAV